MKSRHVLILFSITLLFSVNLKAQTAVVSTPPTTVENGMTPAIKTYCEKVEKSFKKYGWEPSECDSFKWSHYRNSVLGDPLMWTAFGDVSDENQESFKAKDVTIIMCGVHGDEITPIKFCFDILHYLRTAYNDPEKLKNEFHNKVVLVSPIVNPDSYFKAKPTRMNARGIDPNRNFPTKDWQMEARKLWLTKFKRDKRRNPGEKANSEPEVIFQVNFIKRFNPDKIVSVHSPLTLLDYDGPSHSATNGLDGSKAQELLIQMSKDADGYNIKDYPFFPGSLGNWAGKERNIPTYTLELPSSDPRKSAEYWTLFKEAMHKVIVHNLRQDIAKAPQTFKNDAPEAPGVNPN